MASVFAVALAANVSTVAATSPVTWTGGRAALILTATTYPTTTNLQLQHVDGVWVNVVTTNLTTAGNQVTPFDLPPGQYRLNLNGGTAAALYATIVSVPYPG